MRSATLWGSALLFAVAAPLLGHHTNAKPIVERPWVREVAPGQTSTAAYLVIRSRDHEADALLGATCDAAKSVEIQAATNPAGKTATKLDRLALPARGEIVLAPEGNHLELVGVKRPLRSGERVHLTLTFREAGKIGVDALVGTQEPEKKAR